MRTCFIRIPGAENDRPCQKYRLFSFQTPGKTFLGIDYVVNPEIEAAKAIIRSVEQGATSDIMYFEDSTYQMRSLA